MSSRRPLWPLTSGRVKGEKRRSLQGAAAFEQHGSLNPSGIRSCTKQTHPKEKPSEAQTCRYERQFTFNSAPLQLFSEAERTSSAEKMKTEQCSDAGFLLSWALKPFQWEAKFRKSRNLDHWGGGGGWGETPNIPPLYQMYEAFWAGQEVVNKAAHPPSLSFSLDFRRFLTSQLIHL